MSLLALLAVLGTPGRLVEAQGLTGQISGTVTDSSKGVLPGATVTIKNEATSTTATAVTDSNGAFLITTVIAGRYSLTVSLSNFKTYEAKGLEAYNLFNSTQYSAVDTSAQFDFVTLAQTDTAFGRVQGVRGNSNRVIQLGARFTF